MIVMINNIINILKKDNIGKPPWNYYFLLNLNEKEYPRYLATLFKINTGDNLPLKYDFKNLAWIIDKNKCKTFNQKLQWIKLYGVTDLMRKCTDKVAVRDYVRERIGEQYLKPVLQIIGNCSPSTSGRGRGEGIPLAENDVATYFDQINWKKLPQSFVIKCNHGCKWQYIIKDKEQFLNTPKLFEIVKRNITGWLEQDYSFWGGFEMQYKRIKPKLLIEHFFYNKDNAPLREIEVYCFNGKPKTIVNVRYGYQREITYYDDKFNQIDLIIHDDGNNIVMNEKVDNFIKQTFDLSIELSKDFSFVRCDWLIFQNKIYFNELTFTPYSGLIKLDKRFDKKTNWIIERN